MLAPLQEPACLIQRGSTEPSLKNGRCQETNTLGPLGFIGGAGVIGRDWLGYGSTFALGGGFGFGVDHNTVAGKAGVKISFGGSLPTLK
jgi:hypothetical protein